MNAPNRPALTTSFNATTASAQAVPARTRGALMIINASESGNIAFALGKVATINAAGSITLAGGQSWSAASLGYVPSDAVFIVADAAGGIPVTIIE